MPTSRRWPLLFLRMTLSAAAVLIYFFLTLAAAAAAPAEAQGGEQNQDPVQIPKPPRTGEQVYIDACATCHGPDGRGQARSRVGFDQSMPDFSDPDFASREREVDWRWITSRGGPTKGFSEIMPAFGKALTKDEILSVVHFIHTFSADRRWPRGEFNLPRPFFTGKAFPEDELVFQSSVDEGGDSISGKIVYEQRFGPRHQWEVVVPFGWSRRQIAPSDTAMAWGSSFGDAVLAVKSALYHNLERGSILSGSAELIMPTGDERSGFGKGTFVLEPFLAFGQILPAAFFLQAQAGMEIPFNRSKAANEAFLRVALGRSIRFKPWGRTWSPMVELLAAKELASGEKIVLDLVPQIQVTLNKRQHIFFNAGIRLPINERAGRSFTLLAYVIWDWFDGGFFEGW